MTVSNSTKLVMNRVLNQDNLYAAWDEVRKNKGAPGGDFVSLARFDRRLELYLSQLADRVERGVYQPGKVRLTTIWAGTKRREIAIWCVADRVLQRAVLHLIEPVFERLFHPTSFGYRPRRSVGDAVKRVLSMRDYGFTWVVDADIRDCFASLDHRLLMEFLRERIVDQDLLDLIETWLPYGRPRAVRRSQEPRGISLGGVISPLLCNVYLHQMDQALSREQFSLVRYADDFVIMCPDESERDRALNITREVLGEINLELNSEKTRLTHFEEGFTFLGVTFKGRKYIYDWYDKRVEADDLAENFPLEIDGYR